MLLVRAVTHNYVYTCQLAGLFAIYGKNETMENVEGIRIIGTLHLVFFRKQDNCIYMYTMSWCVYPFNCWPATRRINIGCSRVLPVCQHRPELHLLGSSAYAINQTMATMKKVNSTQAHRIRTKRLILSTTTNNSLFSKRFPTSIVIPLYTYI